MVELAGKTDFEADSAVLNDKDPDAVDETTTVRTHSRNKRGRKPLPESLELEEVSEELTTIPAWFIVYAERDAIETAEDKFQKLGDHAFLS